MKYRKDGKPDGRSLMRRNHHVCNWRCTEIQRAMAAYPPVTLQSIGDRLGLTRERVRQLIVKHGWRKRKSPHPHWRGGTLCTTCGQRVPFSSFSRQDEYAQRRAHNATHVNPHRKKWEKHALVAALYLADWRTVDIAAEVGYDKPEQIYNMLREAGIKPNRGSRYPRVFVNGRLMRKQDAERLAAGSTLEESVE